MNLKKKNRYLNVVIFIKIILRGIFARGDPRVPPSPYETLQLLGSV